MFLNDQFEALLQYSCNFVTSYQVWHTLVLVCCKIFTILHTTQSSFMGVELTVSNDITLLLSWYTNDSQISGLNVKNVSPSLSEIRVGPEAILSNFEPISPIFRGIWSI